MTSSTQNWLEKGPRLVSHVLMVIERWKSEVKGTLEWCIRLWNYFFLKSWNSYAMLWCSYLKIGSKRLKFVYYVQLAVKILKSRKIGDISSKRPYRSCCDLSTTTCIWCISLVSFWHYFNSSFTFRTRFANLDLLWPNFNSNNSGTRIKISKFVKLVLRSQDICLKVSMNSYFDPFITICTWCRN